MSGHRDKCENISVIIELLRMYNARERHLLKTRSPIILKFAWFD